MSDILHFNRNDVKLEVRKRIIAQRPELQSRFSNKIVSETTIYLKGYAEALIEHIEQPYKIDEVLSFVYDIGYEYASKRIEE